MGACLHTKAWPVQFSLQGMEKSKTDPILDDPMERIKELEDLVASLSMKNQILEMQNLDLNKHLNDLLKVKNFVKEEKNVTCSCQDTCVPFSKLIGNESLILGEKKSLDPLSLGMQELQGKDVQLLSRDGMLMPEEQSVGVAQTACLMHPSAALHSVEQHESNLSKATFVEKSEPSSLAKKKTKLNGGDLGWIAYHAKRHIALKMFYLGSRFHGFASDAKKGVTVESELFAALTKSKLWSGDPVTSHYSRCGRTDKGVSATGQVVALFLRSCQKAAKSDTSESMSFMSQNASEGERNVAAKITSRTQEADSRAFPDGKELDYVSLINQALPDDIRILGWCPVPDGFHSRFCCLSRDYDYYFMNDRNLDIEVMKVAAEKLIGDHDFRNFCKMDAKNVHNYRRTILAFDILPCHESSRSAGEQTWRFHVKGTAFLWHQVRCMVAVLFMIGEGKESPQVVDELLDVQKSLRKPQYKMAPSLPLVLQSCEFHSLSFKCSPRASMQLRLQLEDQRKKHSLVDAILMESLDQFSSSVTGEECRKSSAYVPLMLRPTEPSYEERRTKFLPQAK